MIQAAIRGQGVALGRQPLVSDLIESGALVAPFKQTLVGFRAYFIIESPLSVRQAAGAGVRTMAGR
jgi:LysR family glycine cleavage system transcriptional activator